MNEVAEHFGLQPQKWLLISLILGVDTAVLSILSMIFFRLFLVANGISFVNINSSIPTF